MTVHAKPKRSATQPSDVILQNPLRSKCASECMTCAGTCYFLGSLSGLVSIITTTVAIAESPANGAYALTTAFLALSYLLKLAYYYDKKLAFLINGILAVGWSAVFLYAIIAFAQHY